VSELTEPRANLIQKLFKIFVHPLDFMKVREFTDSAWFPLMIVTIGLVALRLTLVPEFRKEYSSPEFLKSYMERRQVTEEQAAIDIKRIDEIAPVLSILEAPVMVVLGAAGVTLFLSLIGRIGYKTKLPFREIFNMTAWASVVSIFPILVQTGMKYYGLGDGLPTNISYYLPKSLAGSYLSNLLQMMDAFLFWQVWLLGLGMAALYGVSKQRAISSVGTLFVILAIFNAMAITLTAQQ